MNKLSAKHATFVIERTLTGRPERAFQFWSDPELKRRWTSCHPDWKVLEYKFDFQVGGTELNRLMTPGGVVHVVRSFFLDIMKDARIIYAYEMSAGDQRISASLATVEFSPSATGTAMKFTEQAAFIDGAASVDDRQWGTETGFERLAIELERDNAPMQ